MVTKNRNIFIFKAIFMVLLWVCVGCSNNGNISETSGVTEDVEIKDTSTPVPTQTKTNTPEPSNTPTPTETPTITASPTNTPTPTLQPVGGGGFISFTSIRLGSSFNSPASDIVLLDPNNGELRWLTNGVLVNESSAWSPSGDQLIFTKDNLPYTVDVNGENQIEIDSPFGSSISHPSWSSNDDIMAIYAAPGKYPQLWQASLQDLEWGVITPELSFQFNSVWSPDGTMYAFSGSPGKIYSEWFNLFFGNYFLGGFRLTQFDIPPRDVYIVDAVTGEMTQLTTGEGDDYDPAWSQDGTKLAYASNLDENNSEIFVMDRDGSNQTQLTFSNAQDNHPSWSPDGSLIAFSSDSTGNFEIYTVSTIGESEPVRMTNNVMDDLEPVWSPAIANLEPVGPRTLVGYQPQTSSLEDVVTDLENADLLNPAEGWTKKIDDWSKSWAQLNWYTWSRVWFDLADFVVSADATWESASDKANWRDSGCGFVFRESNADNHYVVFLDMDGFVQLARWKNGSYGRVARSSSSYPVEKPKDSANLMLAVQGNDIRFFVNGLLMLYRQDTAHSEGSLGLTLMSGTNKDFGTSCEMENVGLWIFR